MRSFVLINDSLLKRDNYSKDLERELVVLRHVGISGRYGDEVDLLLLSPSLDGITLPGGGAYDARRPLLDDARFFRSDLFQAVAEHVHVVVTNRHDCTANELIYRNNVCRVQETTDTALKYDILAAGVFEDQEGNHRHDFEKPNINVVFLDHIEDSFESQHCLLLRRQFAVDEEAFATG